MNVTGKITTTLQMVETLTIGTQSQTVTDTDSDVLSLANGTAANQIDLHYEENTTSIAAGGNLDLTLSALVDGVGRTVNFAHVKVIEIRNPSTTAGDDLILEPGATNPVTTILGGTTPTLTIPAGGKLVITAPLVGWAITASTADKLRIHNNSGSNAIVPTVFIAGTSV